MQKRGEQLQQEMLPYQILPGMLGGTYSTGIVTPGHESGGAMGMVGGALGGAKIGSMFAPGIGTAIGAGAGALMGGK